MKINSRDVTSLLFVCIFLLLICLVEMVVANEFNSADSGGNHSESLMTQHFLCTDYGDLIHCDPSLSSLESFEITGDWTEIYRPSGIPTYIDGKYGKALMLQGSKYVEPVEINNTSGINPVNFSLSFWLKQIPSSESSGAIISHSSDDNDAGWDFTMSENGTVSFEVSQASGEYVVVSDVGPTTKNISLQPNEFIHIVGTFNGSFVSIYKNGQIAEQSTYYGQYIPDPGSPLKIGASASSAGSLLWTGMIDDLRIYNRTLDQDEITSFYESRISQNESLNGLISHWSFDETLNDTYGTNDGQLRTLISSMAFSPDGRLFFSEKNKGQISIMEQGKVLDKPFARIPDSYVDAEQGLLGISIDPYFEKNHYVYLYYTTKNADNGIVNRLIRFTDINNTATNRVTLIDNIPATAGYHSGGAIAFGPDDKIYLGIGDATISEYAQDPSVLLGKVLRINRDGTIPDDNPFPNSPVYTLGHRNMYGIAFDSKSGFGIIAENGDALYDEINMLHRGGNYGFPTLQPPNIAPEVANSTLSVLPVRSYWRTPAPTQTIFYDGDKYPALKNKFLVGTFVGDLYALEFDPNNKTIVREQWIKLGIYPYTAVIATAASPVTDEIYFASNAIYKLTSLDLSNKKQTVFPITSRFSTENSVVNNVNFLRQENQSVMTVEFQTSDQTEAQKGHADLILYLEIPKSLIENIYEINLLGDNDIKVKMRQNIEFVADVSKNANTLILFKYLPSTKYNLEVIGSTEINATSIGYDNATESTFSQNLNMAETK